MLSFIILLFSVIQLAAQYVSSSVSIAADATSKVIALKSFQAIKTKGDFQVYLMYADSSYAIVDGDETAIKQFKIRQSGKELFITYRNPKKVERANEVKVHLYSKNFTKLTVLDNSVIEASDALKEEQLLIKSFADGKVNINAEAKKINCFVRGKGELQLRGACNKLYAKIRGINAINAAQLKASKAVINMSGRGHCTISSDKILAFVRSNCYLYFDGNPRIIAWVQMGGGLIRQDRQ